jgi:hypothetical protein
MNQARGKGKANSKSKNNRKMNSKVNPKFKVKTCRQKKTSERGAFEVFPNLPIEIRVKIWRAALPGTGLVVLEVYSTFREDWSSATWKRVGKVFCNKIAPPIVLQVCQESRAEILKACRPVVSCQIKFEQTHLDEDGEEIAKVPGATTIPQDKVVEMGREFQRRHPTWQQPWVQLELFQKVKICTLRNPFLSTRKDQYWRWESLLKEMPKTVGEVYDQTSQEGEVINPSPS